MSAPEPDVIERLNTALSGQYAIEREIGQGGMATVYLADDLRHDRKVALKVLKPELAAVVGGERFLAEIKTTAKLQHPHVLPLFDSGEADTFLYFVTPYIEGESLRERIDREKQLSVDEAVSITRKVADALDYAHEHGVVHHDIKPGNILISDRGEPLVADFGTALAVAQAGGGRITETGLSLGTPHYMSPEQASGDRDIDPRSDVYSLASVLYELLAGQPPFAATTAQAVLVQILTAEAQPVTKLRKTVPPHVSAALTRGLEKLPADRFPSALSFSEALGDEGFRYATVTMSTGEQRAAAIVPSTRVGVAGSSWLRDPRSIVSLAAVALVSVLYVTRQPADPPLLAAPAVRTLVTDFELRAPGNSGVRMAIAPDGSRIAFASEQDGVWKLFVRESGEIGWREIPETDGASHPTFSPDGRSIAFTQDDANVVRVELDGGPVRTIASGTNPHWGASGHVVYISQGGGSGVCRLLGEPPCASLRIASLLGGPTSCPMEAPSCSRSEPGTRSRWR